MLEMTRDLEPSAVEAADAFLMKAGALPLTKMRARVLDVIPTVAGARRSSPLRPRHRWSASTSARG